MAKSAAVARSPSQGPITIADSEDNGEIAAIVARVLRKILCAVRVSRVHLLRITSVLPQSITQWPRSCDQMLYFLICYSDTTAILTYGHGAATMIASAQRLP